MPEAAPEDSPYDGPSKSQLKRDAHGLQALGTRLIALTRERLRQLELPELLHEAIEAAQAISAHEGRRRQLQYIGKLMREVDPEPIRAQLAIWDGTSAAEVARQHALERWRTRLLADDAALTEFAARHPGCDTQRLRTLLRNVRREAEQNRPPRSYRELFRLLRAILDDEPRTGA
jgi:ribosome-associated protein